MDEGAKLGSRDLWDKILHMRWHQWGRGVAILVLLDQWLGPLGGIPSSEAIVVVALGALFAPTPGDRKKDQ